MEKRLASNEWRGVDLPDVFKQRDSVNIEVHFSTGKDNWGTPRDFLDFVQSHYKVYFTLDAAADATNHVCNEWYGPGGKREDALEEMWSTREVIWLNPPYSRGAQRKFVERAVECSKNFGIVFALLPARTDTKLFHELIWDRELRKPYPWVEFVDFLKGRLKFVGAKASAPFPSMLVKFRLS